MKLIILLTVLSIACIGYFIIKYILSKLKTVKLLRRQVDELYYIASRNYQMLSEAKREQQEVFSWKSDDTWSQKDPDICHALGEIDRVKFTECQESFEKHYQEGYRVFELDFCLTKDNNPVVLHDWNRFNKGMLSMPSHRKNNNDTDMLMTYEEFAETKILGKYTSLTMNRFVSLADRYPDAYFIISAKSLNQQYDRDVQKIFSELFNQTEQINPDLKKRYILHAYSFDFLYKSIVEFPFSAAIYRCKNYIHPLVLAEELKKCGIAVITIEQSVYSLSREYCKILHDNGIKIIGCVTTLKENDENIRSMKDSGVDMIMTSRSLRK